MTESLLERDPLATAGPPGGWTEHRRVGVRLLRRLVFYHLVLAAGLLLIAVVFPDFTRHLPIGAVKQLIADAGPAAAKSGLAVDAVVSVASATDVLDRLGTARQLALIMIGTWLLMLPVSWVHKCIHRTGTHDHSLDETVLILPGIVAGLVLVVQHSLALAFSLAGIVAGVQFRRALQDTFDALFILVAIGTGIAAGVRALEIAAVLTVFFTYSTLYVHYFGDGLESDFLAREERKETAQALAGDVGEGRRRGLAGFAIILGDQKGARMQAIPRGPE